MLGDQRHGLHGRDAGLLHGDGDLRAVRIERAVRGDDAGLQHGHARLPGLQRRRRVRRDHAGLPGVGRLWSVLGHECQRLQRRDPLLLYRRRRLRELPGQRRLLGNDADLQRHHARLPGLHQRRAVSGSGTGLPGVGRLRSVLGHQHREVHGSHARLLHDDGYLRAVYLERAVRRNDAGVQHGDARLPRLRRRR